MKRADQEWRIMWGCQRYLVFLGRWNMKEDYFVFVFGLEMFYCFVSSAQNDALADKNFK